MINISIEAPALARKWRYTSPMRPESADPAPDPVIAFYKKDVDRTLLRENLKLTPQQRLDKLMAFMRSLDELRAAVRRPAR